MKTMYLGAASALALALAPSPAMAQHAHMPGMTMPMPDKKDPAKKKPVAKKLAAKAVSASSKPSAQSAPPAAAAGEPSPPPTGHDMPGMAMPPPPAPETPTEADVTMPMEHGRMEHGSDPAMAGMPGMAMGHGDHAMRGALGAYPSTREASGTAWQPDTSTHEGLMTRSGDWMLMAHGNLTAVTSVQGGPSGDSKAFVEGMQMGMARRDFANGDALQFRAMVSPDPLMGKAGYPILLASGETADGVHRLIDRQHPHDLFMELSASYAMKLGDKSSAFVYAALPGEPAFGPPAFMHRQAISVSPEAPITHHWLDSTHISFGVLTGGLVFDRVKVEASRFNAREPDQHRWNIETGPLDSTAVRLSWNPAPEWSLQGSWATFKDPEQLEPGVDQRRLSASAAYTKPMARGWWAISLAWGRKTIERESDDAFALESSLKRDEWTLFGRGEIAENRELLDDHVTDEHGPAYRVGKASLGVARELGSVGPLAFSAGVTGSLNFVPAALENAYGGKHPLGGMAFVRASLK